MISQFYVDAVHKSRDIQLSRIIGGGFKGLSVFETVLDMGQFTGKSKAAFDIIKQSRGTLNLYIGPTKYRAYGEAKINGFDFGSMDSFLLSAKDDIVTMFRGHRIEHQTVNLILDGVEISQEYLSELVYAISMCMRSQYHPFPYIHVIRLG